MSTGIIKKTDLQLAVNEELVVGGYLYGRDGLYRIKAVNDDGSVVVDEVNPETLEAYENSFKKDYRITSMEYYKVLGVDVEKIKSMAERLLNGEPFEEFTESSDTALMSLGSKETLVVLRENINRAALVAEKTRKYADLMIQQKTKELEAENEYIKMFVGQVMAKGLQTKDGISPESVVRVAIDTIKKRLKWKRPITAKEKETYTLVERTLFSQTFRNKYFKQYGYKDKRTNERTEEKG